MIEKINDKPGEYGRDFMKNKFNSHDNLKINNSCQICFSRR